MAEGLKKKAAAHNKKQRKLAKKDVTWKSRHKKDPGIPSAFPYKDQILAEMEDRKREELEKKEEKKQQKLALIEAAKQKNSDFVEDDEEMELDEEESGSSNRLGALLESAKAAADEYKDEDEEMDEEDDEETSIPYKIKSYDSSKEASKLFKEIYTTVVDLSDVILYVLDARDPEGTRSKQVESVVLSDATKRLVFVLNKVDLVPTKALQKWLAKLRTIAPTIPVISSEAAPNAVTFSHTGLSLHSSNALLLKSLSAYASKAESQITFGVVGYPNVGKSSVINSLYASKHSSNRVVCPVDTVAGVTKRIQSVKIDKKLRALDTPGFVFPNESKRSKTPEEEHTKLVLLNALPHRLIGDPSDAVSLLLKRLTKSPLLKEKLFNTYGIASLLQTSAEDTRKDFLTYVARKRGRLNKQGIPDFPSAATSVLTDWRDGRIVGWTVPKSAEEKGSTAKNLKKWNAEFSLNELLDENFEEDAEMA